MNNINIPRPEYPRPQFVRDTWQNLNGSWSFAFDPGNSGKERGLFYNDCKLPLTINVPFCPESRLSGLAATDFMAAVWYRRAFTLTEQQTKGRVHLHFGAVDYHCEVWINEQFAGSHNGGYSSFCFNISLLVKTGENTVSVYAADDLRSGKQPAGKQSPRYESYACSYTRTTGIWQTVWLEFTGRNTIDQLQIKAGWQNRQVAITASLNMTDAAAVKPYLLQAELIDQADQKVIAAARIKAAFGPNQLMLAPADEYPLQAWQPGQPVLYDLKISLLDESGQICDTVGSYCGFRDIELRSDGLYLNGKPLYQRLILDQGFYPDGIYTAPDDGALRRDIELSMDLGFNGARLHEKVFEPRFLYWADRLGYLVWGEQANWVLDVTTPESLTYFLPEWIEVVQRDFNHPAIIGWCPFNETWDHNGRRQCDSVIEQVYLVTKALDPTRPVIDTSGNYHVQTDIFDIHDYEQDVAKFTDKFAEMAAGGKPYVTYPDRQQYQGQPYFVSEYGGAWWSPGKTDGWGYGNQPRSEEEFIARYRGLTEVLMQNKYICAFCYTQLTDVEQEQNGLYTYERKPKFAPRIYDQIRQVNQTVAAFEKRDCGED